jgi:hypothetical protein
VPDLASTLTTPERGSETARPSGLDIAEETWNHGAAQEISQGEVAADTALRLSGSEVVASLDRMQSDLDRWQTERDYLRTFLNTQQNRQLALEEQNTRLRRQHSRLAEENSRLFATAANHSSLHLPSDILSSEQGDTTLSNLASAIAEVGRDSYSTRRPNPARQRRYDWAASHSNLEPQESIVEMSRERLNRDVDTARHRELDAALRSYRTARNAFRSERPGSDVGTVPTAAALRAYWSEEDQQDVGASQAHTEAWTERHRRNGRFRWQDHYMQTMGPAINRASTLKANAGSDAESLRDRIRNTIQYLSRLRSTNDGLYLARLMDLDDLYESAESHIPNELPLLVDSLPRSEPTSWLTPGMTWHGLQSTDREHRASASMLSPAIRTLRQRDYFGRHSARRGAAEAQRATASFLRHTDGTDLATANTDRYLSSLMRDPDGRWGFGQSSSHPELPGSSRLRESSEELLTRQTPETEQWPVTVTLHSIDRENMTVSGTMRASQIPDRRSTGLGKSMESYFQGEIIDFRKHSLETDSKRGYRVGGADVDARYWSRLGPFKDAIKAQAKSTYWDSSTWEDKLKTGDAKYWEVLKAEERAYRELEADRVMMRCLGNQKWLQEKLGNEWVLMRWKGKSKVLNVHGLI